MVVMVKLVVLVLTPTLETGNKFIQQKTIPSRLKQSGFTLLEILLVIVIIAVTAAMIVPSISSVGLGSVADESKRLRLVLRLAMDETQLSGQPLRWLATTDGWSFEVFDGQTGEWSSFQEEPLNAYTLPAGVRIMDVNQAADFALDMQLEVSDDADAKPVIGLVLLLPDGTTSQSNIRLVGEADNDAGLVGQLEVRPGPSGIRLKPITE